MSPALRAAAEAVVKAPGWRWLRGMMDTEEREVCRVLADGTPEYRPDTGHNQPLPSGAIPDLDDPLTAAGLLVVAREVWRDPLLYAVPCYPGPYPWGVRTVRGNNLRSGFGPDPWGWDRPYATEPEALCAAILAAPKETP